MKLSFINNQVRVDMMEHLRKLAKDFGEELTDAVTPARNNLKSIDPKSPLVDEKKKAVSQHIHANHARLSKRTKRSPTDRVFPLPVCQRARKIGLC